MRLTVHPDVRAFLGVVRAAFEDREAEHHLVLGIAEGMARTAAAVLPFAATVEDARGLALAGLMTGRRPLLLASDRDTIASATELLWDGMVAAGQWPRRVIGAVGQIETFVERWQERAGQPVRLAMRQRLYRLTAVEPVPPVPGAIRVATASDLELVADWVAAFEREALGPSFAAAARSVAEQRVADGEVYLWEDPEPRAMACSARPTAHGVAVNAVYTPPEWRGRGYATACVAELSARLLRAGFEFCVLYTDLANPTSNSIYTRIGYRPLKDFLMYDLDRAIIDRA